MAGIARLSLLALCFSCKKDEPAERNVSPSDTLFELDAGETVGGGGGKTAGYLYGSVELVGDMPSWGGTCDQTFSIVGQPYTGECKGCTFNFQVISTESRDDGDNCPGVSQTPWQHWVMIYKFSNWKTKVLFGFHPNYQGYGIYGNYAQGKTLLFGLDGYPFPGWYPTAYEDAPLGTVFNNQGTLNWAMDWSYVYATDWANTLDLYCTYYAISKATGAYIGGATGSSAVDCNGATGDVWEFQGVAGETASITVDTVSEDSAFEPWFWLNDGASCTQLVAFDNFTCSHGSNLVCPSAQFATNDDTYQLVVQSDNVTQQPNCTGKTAEYAVDVSFDVAPKPTLTLVNDDFELFDKGELQINNLTATGSAYVYQ